MQQHTDVKARAVLIVWNLMLTVAVIAMSFRLATVGAEANRVADLEAVQLEMVTLLDQMVETDKNLANALTTSAESIDKISGATVSNLQSIELLLAMIRDQNEWATEAVAEIYQGHIIPLRALHMESGD